MCYNTGMNVEKKIVNIGSLVRIAIFLDGYKQGKGNLLPLGTEDLKQLWDAIKYLKGDATYKIDDKIK